MANQVGVSRFWTRLVTFSLVVNNLLLIFTLTNAELSAIPLWNQTSDHNATDGCHLSVDKTDGETLVFTGDPLQTCTLEVILSNETAALIQIPYGAFSDSFLYAERQGELLECQNRYVVFTANVSCAIVIGQPEINLHLIGNTKLVINDIPMSSALSSVCLSVDYEGTGSEVSQTLRCSEDEFNKSVTCIPDYWHACYFDFPLNCNATLGDRDVFFQCSGTDSMPTGINALFIYPNAILTLNLVYQNIVAIHGKPFQTLIYLDTLNLALNRLVHLHCYVFADLKNLTYLSLFGNHLITACDSVFKDLKILSVLDLSLNYFHILPAELFQGLANLTKLYLEYNHLATINKEMFSYLKSLTELHLYGNYLKELPERLFSSMINLKELDLNDNKLVLVVNYSLAGLHNLNNLWLDRNHLNAFPTRVFKGLENLRILHLEFNQINSLGEDLFLDTTNLTFLDLRGNNLTNLPGGLFRTLDNIDVIYLEYNQIMTLGDKLFFATTKLFTLSLNNNKLTVLSKTLLKGMQNLDTLNLDGNQIASLDGNLFEDTNVLYYLTLNRNKITALPRELFQGLTNLHILYLDDNKIASLDEDIFNDTQNLYRLNLRNNNLKVLPKGLFQNLNIVDQIDISGNRIISVHENLFDKTILLATLFLYENQLPKLHNEVFQHLPTLRVLFMHSNKLTTLYEGLFWGLQNLEVLDLARNNLTSLGPAIFKGLQNLYWLFLNFNQLHYLDISIFQYSLKLWFIDLSNNKLTQIPDIDKLSHLFIFNIHGNALTWILKSTFDGLPGKVEMLVSQPEICVCYTSENTSCSSVNKRSPYLTCGRLLSDRILMVMMWLIGLNAIGGNMFVLSFNKVVQNKNKIQTFLLSNLAMSDLLMGIYMLLIASADIYFGNYFPMQAEAWRSGVTCRIAGALSVLSSEASVFFVTLISIDRFIHIRYPYSRRKLGKRSSIILAVLVWFISLILGIVPSSLAGRNYKFYHNSHVCVGLPLALVEHFDHIETSEWMCPSNEQFCYFQQSLQSRSLGKIRGMYFASAIFLGVNCICYFIISVCYVEIVRFVFKSSKRAGLNREMKDQMRMTIKVAAIVFTDFACWFPVILMGILVQAGVLILPPSVFAWCVTFVLPINSAINPYLYTIAAIISRRKQAQISPTEN